MRAAITAAAVLAVGLLAANMLGVASAEAPTTPSAPRTITVQGVANAPVAQGSSAAAATADYRQAMAGAVADGQNKAEFLAGKVGATLGSPQSVTEDGGSISCTGGEESSYVEYQGEQPDLPQTQTSVRPLALGKAVAGPVSSRAPKKRSKHKRPTAHKATAPGCTLSTQVSLVYAIS